MIMLPQSPPPHSHSHSHPHFYTLARPYTLIPIPTLGLTHSLNLSYYIPSISCLYTEAYNQSHSTVKYNQYIINCHIHNQFSEAMTIYALISSPPTS